jgi:hypothetical protein
VILRLRIDSVPLGISGQEPEDGVRGEQFLREALEGGRGVCRQEHARGAALTEGHEVSQGGVVVGREALARHQGLLHRPQQVGAFLGRQPRQRLGMGRLESIRGCGAQEEPVLPNCLVLVPTAVAWVFGADTAAESNHFSPS